MVRILLLPFPQAARRAATPAATLNKLAKRGEIPSSRVSGILHIREDVLIRLREERTPRQASPPLTRADIDADLLTSGEVARLFGVYPTTVAHWAREGRVQFFRTPGGHRRYPAAQFREMLGDGS